MIVDALCPDSISRPLSLMFMAMSVADADPAKQVAARINFNSFII
jgi:hypothetical protein